MRKIRVALMVIALAFVCVLSQSADAAGSDETGTVTYNGKTFTVGIDKIGKDDKGKTTVTIHTNFEVTVKDLNPGLAMNALMDAIRVKIVANNKTVAASTLSTKAGGFNMSVSGAGTLAKFNHVVYKFDTTAQPEKIIVYNQQGTSITFDGKTKRIIR